MFLEFLLNVLCFWTLVSFVSEYHISYRDQSWGGGDGVWVVWFFPRGRKMLKTFDKVLLLSVIMDLQ